MAESEIPADIMQAAWETAEHTSLMSLMSQRADIIAEALLAERKAQQSRAATILSGVADVMAKHMTDQATPELLTALSDAIRQDNPNEQDERYRALAEMAEEAKKLGLE